MGTWPGEGPHYLSFLWFIDEHIIHWLVRQPNLEGFIGFSPHLWTLSMDQICYLQKAYLGQAVTEVRADAASFLPSKFKQKNWVPFFISYAVGVDNLRFYLVVSPSAYEPTGCLWVWFIEGMFLTSIHLVIECPHKSQHSLLLTYTGCRAGLPRAGPGSPFWYVTLGQLLTFYVYFPPL